MTIQPRRSAESAFSLVEVIVCTAIMAVVFVSLYGGISSGFAVVNLARENLRANQIIVEKMETIRLYNWDQINSNGFLPPTFSAPFFPGVITNLVATNADGTIQTSLARFDSSTSGGLTYYGTVNITNAPVSDQYSTNMRLVTVSLSWTNRNNVRNRQLQTLVSQNGMQNYIYY
jgi:prepilin-type N-terminal cleavage/methylation domain-containing protein